MKKVLGWAVLAMLVGMVAYFGLLRIGMPPVSAALAAAGSCAIVTVMAFDAFYSFVALLAVLGVVFTGRASGVLAVVLATCLTAVAAFHVAKKVEIEFKWVFVAYLVEGASLYTTLKLGLWQPAAGAALLLGIWWLFIKLAEKMRPVASV